MENESGRQFEVQLGRYEDCVITPKSVNTPISQEQMENPASQAEGEDQEEKEPEKGFTSTYRFELIDRAQRNPRRALRDPRSINSSRSSPKESPSSPKGALIDLSIRVDRSSHKRSPIDRFELIEP